MEVWNSHIVRRSDEDTVKHSLSWNSHGIRGKGRPKQTRKRTFVGKATAKHLN